MTVLNGSITLQQTSGGGGGAVDSVNGATGVVVLDTDDISDSGATNKYTTSGDISKLAGIEAGAQVNTVDSVNGATGTVVLDADDIDDTSTTNKFTTATEITKLAGIEAGAEVNQNAFSTVAVSGESDVVADSKTDTLTFAAGSNMTITTDAGTDTITFAASGGGGGASAHPGFATGAYYGPAFTNANAAGTLATNSSQIWCVPFYVPVTQTFTRIGVDVRTTDSAQTIRLGIYENDSTNFVPGALSLDAGTVSTTSSGEQEITISKQLSPGWYWLAMSSSTASAGIRSFATGNMGLLSWMMGLVSAAGAVSNRTIYYKSSGGGAAALPDPLAGTGFSNPATVPQIWLRVL